MTIKKNIPARIEKITLMWGKFNFLTWTPRCSLKSCGLCKHKFVGGEKASLFGVLGKSNMLLCNPCAEEVYGDSIDGVDYVDYKDNSEEIEI